MSVLHIKKKLISAIFSKYQNGQFAVKPVEIRKFLDNSFVASDVEPHYGMLMLVIANERLTLFASTKSICLILAELRHIFSTFDA